MSKMKLTVDTLDNDVKSAVINVGGKQWLCRGLLDGH